MVHGNKKLLTDTVPVNKELLTGTVPVNNLFQIIIEIVANMPLPVVCLRATECNATACANLFIPPYNMIMTDNNVVLIVLGPNK